MCLELRDHGENEVKRSKQGPNQVSFSEPWYSVDLLRQEAIRGFYTGAGRGAVT